MAINCPSCGHEFTPAQPASAFDVVVTDAVKSLAFVMSKSDRCEEGFKSFLKDLQGKGTISEKQKKFFCVIHNKVTGKWPEDKIWTETKTTQQPMPDNLNEIPF